MKKQPDLSKDIEFLYDEFGTFTPRATVVAEKYLAVTSLDVVAKMISDGNFPFRSFKASSSKKAPYLVHVRAVAEYLHDLDQNAA